MNSFKQWQFSIDLHNAKGKWMGESIEVFFVVGKIENRVKEVPRE
jgi:hypothetical protein